MGKQINTNTHTRRSNTTSTEQPQTQELAEPTVVSWAVEAPQNNTSLAGELRAVPDLHGAHGQRGSLHPEKPHSLSHAGSLCVFREPQLVQHVAL